MNLNNPAGATEVVITFGLFEAGNDWWWALDNIVVTGRTPIPCDFDENGIVDEDDLILFDQCVTGPAIPYGPGELPPGCALPLGLEGFLPADLDHDHDVDLTDYGIFQVQMTLSQIPVDPTGTPGWPTYQHDNSRGAKTPEMIRAADLLQSWTHASPHPPQPAWAGPAKWDAYRNMRGLRSMRNYDPVFHVIVAERSLFFGSSVDDSIHCLDAATGEEKWSFCTDGPVRIAPTFVDGKVYFGSDDGYGYCVRAADGTLVWKFNPAPSERLILNNGRFIPLWPCRTGVLVDEGTAYFATALLPWKNAYLSAVDAATGTLGGSGRFVRQHQGVTLEGAMLASEERLIVPQGRVAPLVFNRDNGGNLGRIRDGGGGCFVLLTNDDHVLHGPGNNTGWITDSNATTLTKIASYNGGNAMVVAGDSAYLLTDTALTAIDRATRQVQWRVSEPYPYALILAGDTLFVGGTDEVAAFRAENGQWLWSAPVQGRAYGLAVAGGGLFVSTDEGVIHCFRPAEPGADLVRAPEAGEESAPGPQARGSAQPTTVAVGPYLQFVSTDSAVVRWQTEGPSPTILDYGLDDLDRSIEDPSPKTHHAVTLSQLRRNRVYSYVIRTVIDGQEGVTGAFECDTFFNFALPDVPDPGTIPEDDPYATAARQILSTSGVTRGLCLVVGSGEGRLALELAKRSKLRVVGVDTDPQKIAAARDMLAQAEAYGSRVAVRQVASLSALPLAGQCANLIVSEQIVAGGEPAGTSSEIFRLLWPDGGMACLGQPRGAAQELSAQELRDWLAGTAGDLGVSDDENGAWATLVRGPVAGAGEWTHQYGWPDNSAYGGEALGGATRTSDLDVQWVGRPGPRAQADRNGRKPSPLAANGRLFTQGLQRIIALDSYNGIPLWSLEIPPFMRFNMPRDCGNWCADTDHVFAAIQNKCWQIDAATGNVSTFHDVIDGPRQGWDYDWSYVARYGNRLVGSAVKQGTAFTDFWGGASAGWYDARSGAVTYKVCSENLFALDAQSGEPAWTYADGVIINSTITIGGGRVFFVESRNSEVKASQSRRVGMSQLWQDQFLVALDVETGRKRWEQPINTVDGQVVFYLAYGSDKLVIVSSAGNRYYVYAYAAANGAPGWSRDFAWPSNNHGKHMSRPTIVGDAVYVRPGVFDLATGSARSQMPGGGCGTYAATDSAFVYRSGQVSMWDPVRRTTSSWSRLRPGCWLSTIPACGMVLSPEGGGGCSCGSWMETSLGFIPIAPTQP